MASRIAVSCEHTYVKIVLMLHLHLVSMLTSQTKGPVKLTSDHLISSTPSFLTHLRSAASINLSWKLQSRKNAAVGLFCITLITSCTSAIFAARPCGCASSTVRLHDITDRKK